jgi:hypothetical protein
MANKRIKRDHMYIGQLVVCSDHPEAQVRTISGFHDGWTFTVEVQWYEGNKQCSQGVDCSMLREPTIKQIEYSIANNGKLVAMNDIMQLA